MNISEWMNTKQPTQEQIEAANELNRRGIKTFTDAVFAIGEPALSIISSVIADPIAGLAGLGMAAFNDVAQGVRTIEQVRNDLTYAPRHDAGKKSLSYIGDSLSGVSDLMANTEDKIGASAFNATSSPLLGAMAKTAPTALAELNPLGKVLKSAKRAGDYTVLTHGSPSSSALDITTNHTLPSGGPNLFHGIFASPGDASQYGGKFNHRYEVEGSNIARSGDVDFDYEKSIETLKKEYPDLDDDAIDTLYEMTAEDADAFSMGLNPLIDTYDDLGEASWEAQRLRGRIAHDQGFDAVEMSDEFGTSYLIPSGSKARLLDIK